MDIDIIRERMESMQQDLLEKYRSEFGKPENESTEDNNR